MITPQLRAFRHRVARHGRDVAHTMSTYLAGLISLAIIFPLTIRHLGDRRYGEYTALYLVFGLAGLWVSAAPNAAMVQLILQQGNDSAGLLRIARRQALLLMPVVAIVGALVAVALYGSEVLVLALAVLTADFFFSSLAKLNTGVVFSLSGVGPASRLGLLSPITRALGVALLAASGELTIETLIALNITTSALVYAASSRARRRAVQLGETTGPTVRSFNRYTVYYGASMLTNEIQNEGENMVMASTRPAAELGQYAAAYRLVSMALIPCDAVISAAQRWFLMRDDRAGAQFSRTFRLAVPMTIYGVGAGVAILIGRDLIQWVVGSQFDDVSTIATWLCLLPVLHGLSMLPPMGLLGLGRNRERTIMGFVTAGLSLLGYLVLVPGMGWRGGVIGTYVSEAVAIVAGFWCLHHYQVIADRAASNEEPIVVSSVETSPPRPG